MIPIFSNSIGKEELSAVGEVFDSKWLGASSKTLEFEKQFRDMFGSKYSLSYNCACPLSPYLYICLMSVMFRDIHTNIEHKLSHWWFSKLINVPLTPKTFTSFHFFRPSAHSAHSAQRLKIKTVDGTDISFRLTLLLIFSWEWGVSPGDSIFSHFWAEWALGRMGGDSQNLLMFHSRRKLYEFFISSAQAPIPPIPPKVWKSRRLIKTDISFRLTLLLIFSWE